MCDPAAGKTLKAHAGREEKLLQENHLPEQDETGDKGRAGCTAFLFLLERTELCR